MESDSDDEALCFNTDLMVVNQTSLGKCNISARYKMLGVTLVLHINLLGLTLVLHINMVGVT